ncbi:MAG: hypothetical protein ACPGFA_11100 [Pikeienuella sp.]
MTAWELIGTIAISAAMIMAACALVRVTASFILMIAKWIAT